jgi:hypothetical protein
VCDWVGDFVGVNGWMDVRAGGWVGGLVRESVGSRRCCCRESHERKRHVDSDMLVQVQVQLCVGVGVCMHVHGRGRVHGGRACICMRAHDDMTGDPGSCPMVVRSTGTPLSS